MSDLDVMTKTDGTFGLGAYVGKTIEVVRMDEQTLSLVFADGTILAFSDEGQDCCEHRYMTCDDDLAGWTGAKLVSARVADVGHAEDADGHDDVHEVQFLRITTDQGDIVVCTHNEHNGYYGGMNVVAREVAP